MALVKRSTNAIMRTNNLSSIWKRTCKGSVLRKFLVDQYVYKIEVSSELLGNRWEVDEIPVDMLAEMFVCASASISPADMYSIRPKMDEESLDRNQVEEKNTRK
jgi:hypothetical protein